MMVFREDRARFDQEITAFSERVAAFGKALKKLWEGDNKKALEPVLGGLIDAVMKSPPARYQLEGIDIANREAVTQRLIEDLDGVFQDLRDSIDPKVTVVHKDVSYESLSDERFRKALAEALVRKDKKSLLGDLFSEYDTAREKAVASNPPAPSQD